MPPEHSGSRFNDKNLGRGVVWAFCFARHAAHRAQQGITTCLTVTPLQLQLAAEKTMYNIIPPVPQLVCSRPLPLYTRSCTHIDTHAVR